MELFHKILAAAANAGASDVHIKVGTPIIFRISRQLVAADGPLPSEEWANNVVDTIVPKHLKKKFEDEHEIDFSYFVEGIGRFRTNIFQQRGQNCFAMRLVKSQVPDFSVLGLPEQIKKIAESPRGIILLAGSTGSGKSTTL